MLTDTDGNGPQPSEREEANEDQVEVKETRELANEVGFESRGEKKIMDRLRKGIKKWPTRLRSDRQVQ